MIFIEVGPVNNTFINKINLNKRLRQLDFFLQIFIAPFNFFFILYVCWISKHSQRSKQRLFMWHHHKMRHLLHLLISTCKYNSKDFKVSFIVVKKSFQLSSFQQFKEQGQESA